MTDLPAASVDRRCTPLGDAPVLSLVEHDEADANVQALRHFVDHAAHQSAAVELRSGGADRWRQLLMTVAALPGACGELLEQHAFAGTSRGNPGALLASVGDVLGGWCALAHAFEIHPCAILTASRQPLPAGSARMGIDVGLVCETVRKCVRDDDGRPSGLHRTRLQEALSALWEDVAVVVQAHDLDWHAALQLHARKLAQDLPAQRRTTKSSTTRATADRAG